LNSGAPPNTTTSADEIAWRASSRSAGSPDFMYFLGMMPAARLLIENPSAGTPRFFMAALRTESTVSSMIWSPTLSESRFVSSRIVNFDTDSQSVTAQGRVRARRAAPENPAPSVASVGGVRGGCLGARALVRRAGAP
jgi:hypothetical protein